MIHIQGNEPCSLPVRKKWGSKWEWKSLPSLSHVPMLWGTTLESSSSIKGRRMVGKIWSDAGKPLKNVELIRVKRGGMSRQTLYPILGLFARPWNGDLSPSIFKVHCHWVQWDFWPPFLPALAFPPFHSQATYYNKCNDSTLLFALWQNAKKIWWEANRETGHDR